MGSEGRAGEGGGYLDGKAAIVVGASRGIGLEFARQLAAGGALVIATARSVEKAEQLQQLAAEGKRVEVVPLDVSDPESIEAFASSLAKRPGGFHASLLLNNAGIGYKTIFGETTQDDMERSFRTNTIGPLLVTQALFKRGLLGGERPSLVANVSSKSGSVAKNVEGRGYAYRASKAALNMVTKSLAVDLKDSNVVCVALHPGWIITDMTKGTGKSDVQTCVSNLIGVLGGGGDLSGKFLNYKGEEVPW